MEFIEYIQSTAQIGLLHPKKTGFDPLFWSLMLFNLLSIAYVRSSRSGYISVLIRTGIYNRQVYQNVQEDLRLNSLGSWLLTFSYFNCFALAIRTFILNDTDLLVWTLLLSAAAVVFIKFALIRFLGFLSQQREGLTEHWINHLIYYQIITLILTPVLCLTHFAPQSVQPSVSIAMGLFIGGMIVLREIQTFLRAIRYRISIVYIILYLCTLELIPLIVLIKVLVR